ncbi:MAG: helix-turn-helix transcriptional regulator [Deltaproteobacteria bacterium]|nr:helix-turn-helix transcriptional regulator [Deltaproteobacteria bacterium]
MSHDPAASSDDVLATNDFDRRLDEAAARALLTGRGLPREQHAHLLALSHGDAGALSLLADVAARAPDADITWEACPELVQSLLAERLPPVPDDAHREALWCAAVLLRTSEELLACLVPEADPQALFAWLARVPFMRSDGGGLYPDDLVRALLDADLRWRRPQRRRDLIARVARFYVDLLRRDPSRRHAAIRAVWFAWRDELRYFQPDMLHASVSSSRPHDLPSLDAIVSRHLGPESLACFRTWSRRESPGVTLLVARGGSGEPIGLGLFLWPGVLSAEDVAHDPGAARLHAALDAAERPSVRYLRFLLDRDHGQNASPTAAAISAYSMERAVSTPGLSNVYSAWTPPELGIEAMGKGATERFAAGDFVLDGRAFGCVRKALDGGRLLDWFIERYVVPLAGPDEQAPRLSPRQRETLTLLLQGKTEKEVALALGLSAHTVHQYVKGLYRVYDVTTRGALVARALQGRG